MTSLTTETPDFLKAVRTALVGQGTGDTEVLDVEVSQREDEAGEITWWLTLLLPRPAGSSWSAEQGHRKVAITSCDQRVLARLSA